MIYKAKNVATDKVLEYLMERIRDDEAKQVRETNEVRKYHEGYRDGLRTAMDIFRCSNYEKDAESQVIENESNIS